MAPTDQQITKVSERMYALDSRHAVGTAVMDLFSLGCWLHAHGRPVAGLKAMDTALKAIDLDRSDKTLFLSFLNHLVGNEARFASLISAHAAINELWSK